MEEISGCDSTSSNAIQAGLACPWRFLTAGTLPAGLGLPVLTRPPLICWGQNGEDSCCHPRAGVRAKGCSTS